MGVAILEPPQLRVAYANPVRTALFGWRNGDMIACDGEPSGGASGEPAASVLAAAAAVLEIGSPCG